MKLKKFKASSVREALVMVKDELGPQAVILKTETLKKGILDKEAIVEVTAALDEKSFAYPENNFQEIGDAVEKLGMYNQRGHKKTIEETEATPAPEQTASAASSTEMNSLKELLVQELKSELAEFKTQMSSNTDIEGLKNEIAHLKKGLHSSSVKDVPADFVEIFSILKESGMSGAIAEDLIAELTIHTDPVDREFKVLAHAAQEILNKKCIIAKPAAKRSRRATLIMFVGPTGVGKTTTVAKLVGQKVLNGNKNIGIISTDCYRIGALEQMSLFAQAADVDFEAVFEMEDVDRALDKFASKDFILIDSAGRSQNNKEHMRELGELCKKIGPDEIHLCLAANMNSKDMVRVYQNFKDLGINRVAYTKLDEAHDMGALFNLPLGFGVGLSFFGTGQKIPDDIMIANSNWLCDRMFKGAECYHK